MESLGDFDFVIDLWSRYHRSRWLCVSNRADSSGDRTSMAQNEITRSTFAYRNSANRGNRDARKCRRDFHAFEIVFPKEHSITYCTLRFVSFTHKMLKIRKRRCANVALVRKFRSMQQRLGFSFNSRVVLLMAYAVFIVRERRQNAVEESRKTLHAKW